MIFTGEKACFQLENDGAFIICPFLLRHILVNISLLRKVIGFPVGFLRLEK